jgi:hypothetical protein
MENKAIMNPIEAMTNPGTTNNKNFGNCSLSFIVPTLILNNNISIYPGL